MNEIDILKDNTKTIKEIADILKCSTATVSRKRKKYGIKLKKGSKKGKKRPWQIKKEIRYCKQCNSIFEATPSNSKIYCSSSCAGKSADKSYMQTEEYKEKLKKPYTPEFRRFRNRVTKLSEKTYQENVDIINPKGYIRTVCGVENGYQLDHILSVKKCYEAGMTPEETSRLENLQILPWKTNLLKR